MSDIGITELDSALDLSGSVARQNTFGGLWDGFAIRGFAGDENLPSGYLINGFSGGRGFSGVRDAANIEKIEVLKGPGSALYGRGEPGGTVNIVTKKPLFERYGYVSASSGSFDTHRIEADYTDAITDSVAFRVNGAYKDAESFRDHVTDEKYSVTPSIVALLSDRTTMSYELELLHQEALHDRGILAVDGDPTVLPIERYLGEPNDGPWEIDATGHQLMVEHELQGDWKVIGALGYRESKIEGISSDTELGPGRQLFFTDQTLLNRQRRHEIYETEDASARVELSGSVQVGGMTHNILMGGDGYSYDHYERRVHWRTVWDSGDDTYTINPFAPVYGQPQPEPDELMSDQTETQEAWGVYFQDQVDLSDRWRVMAGVRFDDISKSIDKLSGDDVSQSDTAVNPRFGLVYEISDMNQLYANFAEGFRPNSGADWQGSSFDPETTKSYELGAKLGLADGRLSATIALFKMEKTNILSADPVHSGFSVALGEAESTGVEVDVSGYLTDSLFLWLSYAYVDAKTTNEIINPDWEVAIPAGQQLLNIPKHNLNLTMTKKLEVMGSPATVGVSAKYVDERPGETIDPSYVLPSYTLVNLFSSYALTDDLEVRIEVDNVLDEEYYPSSYSAEWTTPGVPRAVTARVKYSL